MPLGNLLELAYSIAQNSTHHRTKVGCVIADQFNVLASGFNDPMPDGEWKHAEVMAIEALPKDAKRPLIMAVNWFPCLACAQRIADEGVELLVFDLPASFARWEDPKYKFAESRDLLLQRGVVLWGVALPSINVAKDQ